MIVHQFAQQTILNKLTNLENGEDVNRIVWPNLLMNCFETTFQKQVNETSLTVITNLRGQTHCEVDGESFKICSSSFLVINPFQQLKYTIDEKEGTETTNIHFNYRFTQNLYNFFTTSHSLIFDNIDEIENEELPHFFNELFFKGKTISILINQLLLCDNPHSFDEKMSEIGLQLFLNHQDCRKKINSLKPRKSSTKNELYKRISQAKDIIFCNYKAPLTIEDLSKEVCISKYHFTRLFKDVYGVSPYFFLKTVRLEKAKELLLKNYSIEEVANKVGFAEGNSFINAFKSYTKIYPTQFRNQISKNE